MAAPATVRINKLHHRLSALAPNVLRLQVAARPTDFSNESWAVVNRDLAATACEHQVEDQRLFLETEELSASANPLVLVDANGIPILSTTAIHAGKEGSHLDVQLQPDDLIYGLGQGTGSLNRRDTKKDIWNIDVLGHASNIHPNLRTLYQSIPFAIILRHGRATGLFWDFPGHQHWDFTDSRLHVNSPSRSIDLYIFSGPTLAEVLYRYTQLTGRPTLPPRWAYGYQQSRYSYGSREELESVARQFRERQIPCDVLFLDIGHMDGYRVFTFGDTFRDPQQMLSNLAQDGFKVSAIVDPGVKDDRKFPVLQRGKAKKAFVRKKSSRSDFIGRVWPGESRFPDFTNQSVRQWWADEQSRFQQLGLAGIWNDMTEPAVFGVPGKTLPEDARHRTDFGPRPHKEVHNAYGLLMARSSFAGSLKAAPNHRPNIVCRGGYAGIQRHATVWTGDNSSCWEHLAESIPMLLNLGLSGVPSCGSDVGGFLDDCTGELLVRWTQLAAFTPFFRNHTNINTRAQEPWAFGDEIETICRVFINLRYQLLPYLYSCAAEAATSGAPMMRPLAWHFANDPIAAKCSDQFMCGPSLLLAPIVQKDATARSVYLPRGIWFDFWTGAAIEGGQHIALETELMTSPLFMRGGAIVPMAPPREFIDPAQPDKEITLHVWLGGRGTFTWHEDDGQTLDHLAGDYCQRQIEMADLDDSGFLRFGDSHGNRASDVQIWRIVLHGMADEFEFTANDQPFAPSFDEESAMCSFRLENFPDEFTIRWQ